MKVSVIIPTRARANVLDRCLESLTRQTLPADAFEVLVIDNGSTDHTANVAENYRQSLQITYISTSDPGLHVGRHEGMRRAKTDVLMFADDDIEAESGWVEAALQDLDDPSVALVGGNNHPLFEKEPPAWLRFWWDKQVYKGRALSTLSILDFGEGIFEMDPEYVWGCNFSIRRKALLEAGGFHPDGFPKELLRFRGDGETHVSNMVRRSGLRTIFDSRASVRHHVPSSRMTKDYFVQRAYAQGISDSYSAIRRWGGLNVPVVSRLRRNVSSIFTIFNSCLRALTLRMHPVLPELLSIQTSMYTAYWRGYEFHRREASNDPELLSWILRKNYVG